MAEGHDGAVAADSAVGPRRLDKEADNPHTAAAADPAADNLMLKAVESPRGARKAVSG